jgi:hypothetical protein
MSRPKGSKNGMKQTSTDKSKVKDDPRLPDKSLFRKDEAASYFGVTVRCIDRWLDHGHLEKEKIVGVVRIPRKSILRCRFRKAVVRPR